MISNIGTVGNRNGDWDGDWGCYKNESGCGNGDWDWDGCKVAWGVRE